MKNNHVLALLISLAVLACPNRPAEAQGLGFTQDFATVGPSCCVVWSLATHDDGTGPQLYVGGDFTQLFGSPYYYSQYLVRWNGSSWSSVGWGFDGGSGQFGIRALEVFDDGTGPQLYAGGQFEWVGSASTGWLQASYLVRWDGQRWWPLFPGQSSSTVYALATFDDGSGPQLYVGGGGIFRWNGQTADTTINDLGYLPAPGGVTVQHLCVHDDGSGPALYAAGVFDIANGQPANGLARWDGVSWTPIPDTPAFGGGLGALASFDDGGGAGLFYSFGSSIWRWRGGTWSNLGVGGARSMCVYDDGNGLALFVGGSNLQIPGMTPSSVLHHVARWNGTAWSAVGGPDTSSGWNQNPYAMSTYDFGAGEDLYLGGFIWELGGQTTHNVARYRGAHGLISSVCGGDGSLAKCPCDTRGDVGHGCPNSAEPGGARLCASGMTSDDSITFDAGDLLPSTMSLLFQGNAYDYASTFLGDGVRCTAGSTHRLFVKQAQNGIVLVPEPGDPSLRARANELGDPLPPGSVRYYQLWYRDADPDFCASGGPFNVTNGLRVVW